MEKANLDFRGRIEVLYLMNEVTPYSKALNVKADSYLIHQIAMFLNGLKDSESKKIFVNFEQVRKKFRKNQLEQTNIDNAFSNK